MAMEQGELEVAWRRHCRGKLPAGLPRALVARMLAYRVQVEAHGDLPMATQRFLERLGRELEAGGAAANLKTGDHVRLQPGTVLVRQHAGAEHRVMVLADGFAWSGQVYRSLSAVAFAITGTRWNGRRFFGLDGATAKDREPRRRPPDRLSDGVPA